MFQDFKEISLCESGGEIMEKWKIESDFIHNNLRCIAVMQKMGHRCGYVGLLNYHPSYGKDYSDECLSYSDIVDKPIGKRGIIPVICMTVKEGLISPDVYFDVHGGVTFAGGGNGSMYPIQSDLWWFGFDCAHCDDGRDLETAYKYNLMDEITYKKLKSIDSMFPLDYECRSKEYVENECKSLAEQLALISAMNRTE
jgi:hypothetical protein